MKRREAFGEWHEGGELHPLLGIACEADLGTFLDDDSDIELFPGVGHV